ncbi:MAG TPA: cyanophycin synthetase, partial [Rubricoccaceae bacterium]|jgi:UDP-N-acetylmuramyl tripeptide synthase
MATAAGLVPGVSTTDYVAVGGETLEAGDFSGPMGARAALRDPRATVGILEVARGGLLRRGVPVARASVACVTNVAADHLGEYGVDTVEALAEAKFVVAKALGPGGRLVLSADDARSCAESDRQAGAIAARGVEVCWVSLVPSHPRLDGAAVAASLVDGLFAVRRAGGDWAPLVPVDEAPSAMGGAALHNVRNALSAVATGAALGLPDAALAAGLRQFRGDATDNPGRANVSTVNGATVVVDYAHNAHGLAALVQFAGHLPATRRLLLLSSAGDRTDADVRDMVRIGHAFGADRTLAADLPDYLRGRGPREVSALIARETISLGASPDTVDTFPDPAVAARDALVWARPGDVLLLVVLSHRDEVSALIREAGSC